VKLHQFPPNSQAAYFLVTHGSSNPRSWRSLRKIVRFAQSRSQTLIDGGCLEGLALSLVEQLGEFGDRAIDMDYHQIIVVPLFLLPGMHVKQDLPAAVSTIQHHFKQQKVQFQLTDYLGSHPQIPHLLASQFAKSSSDRQVIAQQDSQATKYWQCLAPNIASPELCQLDQQVDQQPTAAIKSTAKSARLIIAHGSKRHGANQPIEALARSLHATAAYWSVEPTLETQISHLVSQGFSSIDVMPYFLSKGGITRMISERLEQLASQTNIKINLLPVPFTSETIADLALAIANSAATNASPNHAATLQATANVG
jgi:sirohydrochlorin cobaltochelatase